MVATGNHVYFDSLRGAQLSIVSAVLVLNVGAAVPTALAAGLARKKSTLAGAFFRLCRL